MSDLTDADLVMVADVVGELAKLRDASFDKSATGFAFVAALSDPAFKKCLTDLHRRLEANHRTKSPGAAASIASLFRALEAAAEVVVSGFWEMEEREGLCEIHTRDGAD
jgi:hypothetical protein